MENNILFQLIPLSLGLTITLVAFLVTYVMVPQVIHFADRMGIVDIPDKRRIHKMPTPRAGGLAVYVGVLSACFLLFLLSPLITDKTISFTWIAGMLIGSSLVFITGLIDDLIGIRAFGKLFGQILAITVVYTCGIRFQIISGYPLPLALDFILTMLWFLIIINAFNLIDGIDGLAVGIVAISALGVAGFLIQRKLPLEACILFAIMGGALGFLKFNRHPASIFLGDSGSNFLGFLMAAMMIATGSKSSTVGYLWAPLLAIIIPAVDLILAVWRRVAAWVLELLEGKSSGLRVMTGDLEHLHHRLLRLNLHPRDVVATLCLINALFVLGGLMAFPYQYPGWGILLASTIIFGFLAWRYILGAELDKSAMVLRRILVSAQKPYIALIIFLSLDFFCIIFSLLVSIRITHPDFPIPAVFERAKFLLPYWLPLGIFTTYFLERKELTFRYSSIFKKLFYLMGVSCLVSCGIGFIYLSDLISAMRAVSNLVIFMAMNFLLLVFSRFLISILEVSNKNQQELNDMPLHSINDSGAQNLTFYGRLVLKKLP